MVAKGTGMDRLSIAALALTLVAGCKSGDKKKTPPPAPNGSGTTTTTAAPDAPPKLFVDAELTTLESALTPRLDANAKRTCPRPLLKGTARPGPASDDIIAFVEAKDPLTKCFYKIEEAQKVGKLDEMVEKRDASLVAIDKECGEPLATAVTNIATHEDACSPYQPGRRPETDKPLRLLQAAHMLGLRARVLADTDPAAALWLLATSVRAMQDISRGRVNLITSITVAAAYETLLRHVEKILDGGKLAAPAAGELATAFDALLASEPRFADTLQGEQDWKALYGGLMRYMPASWMPPGGAPDPDPRKMGMPPLAKGTKLGAKDSGGLVLQSASEASASLDQACPATASYLACRTGLELRAAKRANVVRRAEALLDPDAIAKQLTAPAGGSADPREVLKRMALDALEPGLHFDYVDFLDKKVKVLWRLPAAQAALASIAAGCKPGQPSKAANDLIGEPMTVTVDAKVITVIPPGFARPPGATFKGKCP